MQCLIKTKIQINSESIYIITCTNVQASIVHVQIVEDIYDIAFVMLCNLPNL